MNYVVRWVLEVLGRGVVSFDHAIDCGRQKGCLARVVLHEVKEQDVIEK